MSSLQLYIAHPLLNIVLIQDLSHVHALICQLGYNTIYALLAFRITTNYANCYFLSLYILSFHPVPPKTNLQPYHRTKFRTNSIVIVSSQLLSRKFILSSYFMLNVPIAQETKWHL